MIPSFNITFNDESDDLTALFDESDELTASFDNESDSFKAVFDETGFGTNDYNKLINKPQIEAVTLRGNKSFEDLGLSVMSNMDIENLINNFA